jgi:hypothetical protein|tara:strand:+ start:274 stop:447 length:174 start_codon:yes stop_codon:yes gene_type:complete
MGTIQIFAGMKNIHRKPKTMENVTKMKTRAALLTILSALEPIQIMKSSGPDERRNIR